ncbi:MAG: enoyl-CoA hydratase [Acidobacteria bacterium]|nr:enoyl-CoA hydratase [Acidobacteriota bacterium]
MSYQQILFEVSERIATITLNRPDKLNAWTAQMDQEVRAAIGAAEADPGVRVIILTGAGRGFCAGADMSLLQGIASEGQLPDHTIQTPREYSYFTSLSKPVIAAINGHAVGLGLIIALYCDLRFASSEAKFGTAFARRGLIAEYGLAWILPKLAGQAHALDLLFSARVIGAEEAVKMGLANRVIPAESFLAEVRAYALALVNNVSPRSTRVIKRQVYSAMSQTLAEATAAAQEEMIDSLRSEDFKEGVAHFIEKRAPTFTGD